jgi:hypothetical protein
LTEQRCLLIASDPRDLHASPPEHFAGGFAIDFARRTNFRQQARRHIEQLE